tara:strand:- start:1110 stop:1790 length:681 start_codon:yes stop_codon:yes gene_type:complete
MSRAKTIFCDIDGTLLKHRSPEDIASGVTSSPTEEALQTIKQWEANGYNIILVTGRKPSLEKITKTELASYGIVYDKLIMGIGGGDRILINDRKPNGRPAAWAVNLDRDKGLKGQCFDNLVVEAKKYFQLFSDKNVSGLQDMFSDDVSLKDWEINFCGKASVVAANEKIFNSVSSLNVTVENVYQNGNKVFAEILVHVEKETIPVLDVLTFNEDIKINSITAYKRS